MLQQSRSMWGRGRQGPLPTKQLTSIVDGLKQVYFSKVRSAHLKRSCSSLSTLLNASAVISIK